MVPFLSRCCIHPLPFVETRNPKRLLPAPVVEEIQDFGKARENHYRGRARISGIGPRVGIRLDGVNSKTKKLLPMEPEVLRWWANFSNFPPGSRIVRIGAGMPLPKRAIRIPFPIDDLYVTDYSEYWNKENPEAVVGEIQKQAKLRETLKQAATEFQYAKYFEPYMNGKDPKRESKGESVQSRGISESDTEYSSETSVLIQLPNN